MTVTSNAEVQSLLLVEDALVVSCIGNNSHERRRCGFVSTPQLNTS
jgi:hypothetical protein